MPILVDVDCLPSQQRQFINIGNNYSCSVVAKLDAAYQKQVLGFNLPHQKPELKYLAKGIKPTAKDNYIFTAHFFSIEGGCFGYSC